MAYRFSGSSDLYQNTGRRPLASINFITAHDGLTLNDLVSYNDKHNGANGAGNRDGANDNRAWNCGVEGPSDDHGVRQLRDRQKRNLLTTLLLSQGVPMLLGGDEVSRSQQGNNNGYCQDNALSWTDWRHADGTLLGFTRNLIALRGAHPVFRRRHWFQGRAIHGEKIEDIAWFNPDGSQAAEQNWGADFAKALGVFLNGESIPNPNPKGEPVKGDSFYLFFNAGGALSFKLPPERWGKEWVLAFDTALPMGKPEGSGPALAAGSMLNAVDHQVLILRHAG
jgi:isoamylase